MTPGPEHIPGLELALELAEEFHLDRNVLRGLLRVALQDARQAATEALVIEAAIAEPPQEERRLMLPVDDQTPMERGFDAWTYEVGQ